MSVSPQHPETEAEVDSTHYLTTWYALIATLQGHLRQASRLYFLGADRRWEQDLVRLATEGAFGR